MIGVGIIAYVIAGVSTFGIAATVTALLITIVSRVAYTQIRLERRTSFTTIFFCTATALLLYLCTFAVFRAVRTFSWSLAHHEDIVVFSMDPNAQQLARTVYFPLIAIVPGDCVYPSGEDMTWMNRDPFSDERLYLYW